MCFLHGEHPFPLRFSLYWKEQARLNCIPSPSTIITRRPILSGSKGISDGIELSMARNQILFKTTVYLTSQEADILFKLASEGRALLLETTKVPFLLSF